MLKNLIAYQRLLLNSTPPLGVTSEKPFKESFYVLIIFMVIFVNIFIFSFSGNTISLNMVLYITFPIISVWMINRILYGNKRIFEIVPVSRKYTFFNLFLLSLVIVFILYFIVWMLGVVFVLIMFGISYIEALLSSSNVITIQYFDAPIIDTTKGDMLMICILLITLFTSFTITFIKNKKYKFFGFVGFATIGYGLLLYLKNNMPISQGSDKVEFIESFSIMPQANIILICVAIATVIICITSGFTSYKLYVTKSNDIKYH